MGVYREHEWHVMELPALTSPPAIRFMRGRGLARGELRSVRVYVIPDHYPDAEVFLESVNLLGSVKQVDVMRDALVEFLREHPSSHITTITKATGFVEKTIHVALKRGTAFFVSEQYKGKNYWSLAEGVVSL